ncbi:hypothetical protein Tco_0711487 [Tanacetum coccineum]
MAELDEIRLLLKDQVAFQKQQSEAFQAQMAALQAELPVTKEMIQAARHGGGTDPDSWIFAIIKYFTLLNTPVDQRLSYPDNGRNSGAKHNDQS